MLTVVYIHVGWSDTVTGLLTHTVMSQSLDMSVSELARA